jgi:hypothetical protein
VNIHHHILFFSFFLSFFLFLSLNHTITYTHF